jgi:hypothetical protein
MKPARVNQAAGLLQSPFMPGAPADKLEEVRDQPGAPETNTAKKLFGFKKILYGVNTP